MGNVSGYMYDTAVAYIYKLKNVLPFIFTNEGTIKIPKKYLIDTQDGNYELIRYYNDVLEEQEEKDNDEQDENESYMSDEDIFYSAEDNYHDITLENDNSDNNDSDTESGIEDSGIETITDSFDNDDLLKEDCMRLNVNTYGELIYRLQTYLELNPSLEHEIYSLQIRYSLINNPNTVKTTEKRFLRNMRIRDMFNILTEEVNRLEEMYDVILVGDEDDDNVNRCLHCAFLTRFTPKFGKGDKNFNFVLTLDNELYSIIFPKTDCKCLITCVYNLLGKQKSDRFFKNTCFKNKSFEEMKSLIKDYLDVDVVISQNIETLKYDLLNKNPKLITLYSKDCHVGYMIKGTEDYVESKRKPEFPSFRNTDDIVRLGYDCEYPYKKINGEFVPQKSNLVTAAIKANNYINQKVYKNFTEFLMFIEMLALSLGKDIYCYAHNAQKVENPFILQEIVKMKNLETYEIKNFSGNKIKSYSYQISKTVDDKVIYYRIYFIDTLCYVKNTLEECVKMFDLTTTKGHVDMPKNLTKEEKNNWFFNKKWSYKNSRDIQYCLNDAIIVLELVEKFNDMAKLIFKNQIEKIYTDVNSTLTAKLKRYFNVNDMWLLNRVSMPSILREIYHNLYPKLLNTSEDASLFKTTYYGGRNECDFIGKSDPNYFVYTIDINSSYPYQMLKGFAGKYLGNHLTILGAAYRKITIQNILDNAKVENRRWMAYIVLKYKKAMERPLLAVNMKGKLIFPNIMNYRLVPIWDVEYEAIKDNLDIKSIEYVGFFEECNFKKEMTNLMKIKTKTTDKALKSFSKITLASIYGILGMDCYRPAKQLRKKNSELICNSTDYIIAEGFDDYEWLMNKKFTKVNSAFQSASCITAQARLHLWQMGNFLSDQGFKLYYRDTDSQMFGVHKDISFDQIKEILKDYLHPTEIGKWDIEKHDQIHVFTNKVYYYVDGDDVTIKFKGLPDNDEIDFKKISKGCEFEVTGTKVNKRLEVEIYKYIKKFSLNYNKGTVLENGDVIPYEI